MGVMQVIVCFVANSGDELRLIKTETKKILFFPRKHMTLVAVGSINEPSTQLCNYLNFVYNQVYIRLFYVF